MVTTSTFTSSVGFYEVFSIRLWLNSFQTFLKTPDKQSLMEINTELYISNLLRRLSNFNRILDRRIKEFKNRKVSIDMKSRLIFLLPDKTKIEDYISRKLEDNKRFDRLKLAKLLVKIIAGLVMSYSFLLTANTMKKILVVKVKSYELNKALKAKAKQKRKNKRKSKAVYNTNIEAWNKLNLLITLSSIFCTLQYNFQS